MPYSVFYHVYQDVFDTDITEDIVGSRQAIVHWLRKFDFSHYEFVIIQIKI